MDFTQAIEFAKAHAWLPLISLALGFIVRMSKSDAIGPVVPSKYRPWLAWTLGAATFVVDSLMGGAPVSAIVYGFGAPLLAILGHKLGIEKLRDGEELPLPKILTRKPDGGVGKGLAGGALVLLVLFVGGCAIFRSPILRTALEEAARLLCVGAKAEQVGVSPEEIRDTACEHEDEWRPFLDAALAAQRAGAVKAGMAPAPLTPGNALGDLSGPAVQEPKLKAVPELEQRK